MKKRKEKSLLAFVGVLFFSFCVSAGDTYKLPNPKVNGLIASNVSVLFANNTHGHNILNERNIHPAHTSILKNNSVNPLGNVFFNTSNFNIVTKSNLILFGKFSTQLAQELPLSKKANTTSKSLNFEFLNSYINFSPIFNFNNCTVMQNTGIIHSQPYCL